MKALTNTDINALYYRDHSQPQNERARELLKSLVLDESMFVLDVGCGYGNITAEISHTVRKGRVIGVDSSPDMINLAREMFPNTQFPNLEFQQAKAEEMNFANGYFDVIICFSCLLWIREPRKALDLMSKSLKAGGVLLILTYLKESAYITFLEKALVNFPFYKNQSAARTMLTIQEYKDTLESNGLELELFHPEWRFSRYENTEELKIYLRGWLSCYVPLPTELQELFLSEAVKECVRENVDSTKDEIVFPYQLLAIKAIKPQ